METDHKIKENAFINDCGEKSRQSFWDRRARIRRIGASGCLEGEDGAG